MKKRILSIILALTTLLRLVPMVSIGASATSSTITVYVTASYEGAALTSTSNGSKAIANVPIIYIPVELTSGATIEDALKQLSKDYYNSDGSGYTQSIYGAYVGSFWGILTTGGLGSTVLLNDADTGYGNISDHVHSGDAITLSLFDYLSDWSGSISSSYLAYSDGNYLGQPSIDIGSSLSFAAYSGSSPITSGTSVYVTSEDNVNYSNTLTPSGGVYSYTFNTAGTYFIICRDNNFGTSSSNYGLSVATVTVADTTTNTAPALKSGVSAQITASTYAGKAYTLNLSNIFEDSDSDPMAYQVKVGNADYVTASSSYTYLPSTTGTTTLVFKANDGTADSADTYNVTLTTTAAPILSGVLSDMTSYYSSTLSFGSDSNFDWVLADMVANGATLSDDLKQDYVDYVVYHASSSSTASTLARYIITLKALGYDATKIDTTGNGTYFNAVDTMISKSETSIYSTPYVLMALQQYGDTYSTEIDTLITTILSSQLSSGGWGYTSMDADTTGPVLLALSPYYSTRSDVKDAVDAALVQLSVLQDTTGAIYSAYGYGACSTGVLIPGLVALGINPDTYTASSFTDGLLLLYNASNRFQVYSGDNYSDEQGFRGLVAANHVSSQGSSGYRIYDFSKNTSNAAVASAYYSNCLVAFSVIPGTAAIVLKDNNNQIISPLNGTSYDLVAGTYTYTVSASGYTEKTATLTVSYTDALHTKKSVSVSLSSAPVTNEDITVTVNVKAHNVSDCDNGSNLYTYKHNSSDYYIIVSETVTLTSGASVFDALDAACTAAGVSYTEASYGYIGTINGLSEFDHGSNSGWLYKVGSTIPTTSCRDYALASNCIVTWFYSDDYTAEYGSEGWVGTNDKDTVTPPETETVIATVAAGSSDAVEVSVKKTDTTAEIVMDSTQLDKIVSTAKSSANGTITFDLSALEGVDKVVLSADALAALGDSNDVMEVNIKTDRFMITLSSDVLNTMANYATDSNDKLTVSAETADISTLNDMQKTVISSSENPIVLDLTAVITHCDEKGNDTGEPTELHEFGGNVTISYAYTLKAGQTADTLVVYYIDEAGNVTYLDAFYVDGHITFVTSHFSTYVLESCPMSKFSDCDLNAWYHSSVDYTLTEELFQGTSDTTFAPLSATSRAMFVTTLWRLEGEPVTHESSFADLTQDWYTNAVNWAASVGIVQGYSNTEFGPDDTLTRAQMVTILWRFTQYKGDTVSTGETSTLTDYDDAKDIADYARSAFQWAVDTGIVNGTSDHTLSPCDNSTRAEAAAILMRFCLSIQA